MVALSRNAFDQKADLSPPPQRTQQRRAPRTPGVVRPHEDMRRTFSGMTAWGVAVV